MTSLVNTTVPVEHKVRLSQSSLWKYLGNYYAKNGVEVWTAEKKTPYFITSNAFIAYSYAFTVWRYLQDGLANGSIDSKEPIYLIELGAGHGKFGYLFNTKLRQLLKYYQAEHLKICYVMTDFAMSNIKFWLSQPQLKSLCEQGLVDFALYDTVKDKSLYLLQSKITLTKNSCKNPIVVIANYIFDSLPADFFRVKDGELEEGLVSLTAVDNNLVGDGGIVQDVEKLRTDFSFSKVMLPYYRNLRLDEILTYYHENLQNTSFLVPTGAIFCLDTLRSFCNDKLLLFVADKAYNFLDHLSHELDKPHMAFHGGSFSVMFNADFFGRYLQKLGGEMILGADCYNLSVSLFSLGQSFNALPETSMANYQFNQHVGPQGFLDIGNKLLADIPALMFPDILTVLNFSYWDADVFMRVCLQLGSAAIKQKSDSYYSVLKLGLECVIDNYYDLPHGDNVLFAVGYIYHCMGEYDKAIQVYEKSLCYVPANSDTYLNVALCYEMKGNLNEAIHYLECALEINPDNKIAQEALTKAIS